jgi:hypothetical protein
MERVKQMCQKKIKLLERGETFFIRERLWIVIRNGANQIKRPLTLSEGERKLAWKLSWPVLP